MCLPAIGQRYCRKESSDNKSFGNSFRKLKQMIDSRNCGTLIEIDGGVGMQNAGKLVEAGATVLVAGSSVFRAENPLEAIKNLKAVGTKEYFV